MVLDFKKIDFFKSNGWLKVDSFLTEKEVNMITKKINLFLKKKSKNYNGRDINYTGDNSKISQINSFHKLHDLTAIKKFSEQKKITNFTKKLLESKKIALKASEYFAKPKKTGLPVPIHQDNYYWNIIGGKALTVWIALSKSQKKNGGVYYFEKSHKKGVLKHVPSFAKGSSQKIKNQKMLIKKYKKVLPQLNKGDALFHHCEIAHGSSANKSQTSRIGLTFQFKDKDSKYDKKLIKKYEKKLLYQVKQRNKN